MQGRSQTCPKEVIMNYLQGRRVCGGGGGAGGRGGGGAGGGRRL